VRLVSVSGGNAAVDSVEAAVASMPMPMPMPMPFVLLGNSFLTRFQMKRENEVLTLTRRF
jgi:aspartyl protease family protein